MKFINPGMYAVTLLVGITIGYLIRGHMIERVTPSVDYETIRGENTKYTRPLIDVLLKKDAPQNFELIPFRGKVEKFVKEELDKKWAHVIAIYFRDLNNGPWFSIGDTNEFYPASLLKVPLMIAVLKQAEQAPEILKKKIHYNNRELLNIQNKVPDKLELGKYYAVEELLRRMISYSDNVSTNLLENFVDFNVLDKTYTHLGIKDPYIDTSGPNSMHGASSSFTISVEKYASFFRVLYNATYLNREMSEKALELLVDSDYNNALTAGVPSDVIVSHKWGYRTYGNNNEIKQLHDCGIFYHTKEPYLLCIMTRGDSFDHLDAAIREISSFIYKEVDAQYSKYN